MFSHRPKNLREIFRRAQLRGGKPFVVTPSTQVSYSECHRSALAVASKILSCGANQGQRVGILLDDPIDWVMAFGGVIAVGCVPVLFGKRRGEELDRCLHLVHCDFVLMDVKSKQALEDVAYTGTLINFNDVHTTLAVAEEPAFVIDENAEALVAFTSGSAGFAKAVVSTHKAVITGLMNMMLSAAIANGARKSGFRAGPACPLILAPLEHVSGYSQILLALFFGSRIAIGGGFCLYDLSRLISEEGITSISGADSALLSKLLETCDAGAMQNGSFCGRRWRGY